MYHDHGNNFLYTKCRSLLCLYCTSLPCCFIRCIALTHFCSCAICGWCCAIWDWSCVICDWRCAVRDWPCMMCNVQWSRHNDVVYYLIYKDKCRCARFQSYRRMVILHLQYFIPLTLIHHRHRTIFVYTFPPPCEGRGQ